MFRNKASFYGEELSVHRPTPRLEDHPLSSVRDCLFSICVATLHIPGRSSIRNLRTRHAVVTATRLSGSVTEHAHFCIILFKPAGTNVSMIRMFGGLYRRDLSHSTCLLRVRGAQNPVGRATQFWTVAPNIFGASVWNLPSYSFVTARRVE